jgi:hypothetical protein
MKKLLAVTILMIAFTPLAQAQGLADHPDARNDRAVERSRIVDHRHYHHHPVKVKHVRHPVR